MIRGMEGDRRRPQGRGGRFFMSAAIAALFWLLAIAWIGGLLGAVALVLS